MIPFIKISRNNLPYLIPGEEHKKIIHKTLLVKGSFDAAENTPHQLKKI
jgi:hypothetical protein